MAKSRDPATLTEAYRRRIERGIAQGKTRQEARGKKAGEYRTRKERELSKVSFLGGLTSAQRQAVRKFAGKQAEKQIEYEPDDMKSDMVEWATKVGYEKFLKLRTIVKEMSAQRRKEHYRGTYAGRGRAFLDRLAFELDDVYPPDTLWMHYGK